jgi:hypothetical protein|tara:strand:- start:6298 stop:6873 length:576 start_codon:yes stop_codon:yes gene_type:complete
MIEKSDNIHFFGTKRQPEITSNPTIPELTQDEINAAKVILLSSTPEEINKIMMNTPNVIDGCSYENHILKIDNLESATKLYREMLKFHIKLDTIKYEANLKRWWCCFNNPRDHTKNEMDIRLEQIIEELADMPLDIARAITIESKKTWLYKPTLFQINDMFKNELVYRNHLLNGTKKFLTKYIEEEKANVS